MSEPLLAQGLNDEYANLRQIASELADEPDLVSWAQKNTDISNHVGDIHKLYPWLPAGVTLALGSARYSATDPFVQNVAHEVLQFGRKASPDYSSSDTALFSGLMSSDNLQHSVDQDVLGTTIGGVTPSTHRSVFGAVTGDIGGAIHAGASALGSEVPSAIRDTTKTASRDLFGILGSGLEGVNAGIRTDIGALQGARGRAFTAQDDNGSGLIGRLQGDQIHTSLGAPVLPQITLAQMINGKGSGQGFFPSGQAKQAAVQAQETAANIGGHALTVGRGVAGSILPANSGAYNLLSGLTDAAVGWYADPAQHALAGIGEVNEARRSVAAADTDWGSLDRLRQLIGIQTAQEQLDSRVGQGIIGKLTTLNSTRSVMHFMGGKIDPQIANQLAHADTPEAVRAVLNSELGTGIEQLPAFHPALQALTARKVTDGFGNPIETGTGSLGYAVDRATRDWRPLADLPGGVFPTDLTQSWVRKEAYRQAESFMVNAKVPSVDMDTVLDRIAGASNKNQMYDAYSHMTEVAADNLVRKYGLDVAHARQLTRGYGLSDELNDVAQHFRVSLEDKYEVPGTMVGGKPVMFDGALPTEMLQNNLPMPDFREIRRAASTTAKVIKAAPGGTKLLSAKDLATTTLDALQHTWKTMQLARPAFVFRVGGEAQLASAAAGDANALTHPFQYVAWAMGKKGGEDILGDELNPTDFAQVFRSSPVASATFDPARVYASQWRQILATDPGFTDAWAQEIRHMSIDDLGRATASAIAGGATPGYEVVRYGHEADLAEAARHDMGGYSTPVDSLGNTLSPHRGVPGAQELRGFVQPRHPLLLTGAEVDLHGLPEGAGILALHQFLGDAEFGRLASLDTQGLEAELTRLYPETDWAATNGRVEALDTLAAQLARKRGYDAFVHRSSSGSRFDEVVALDPSIVGANRGARSIDELKQSFWNGDLRHMRLNMIEDDPKRWQTYLTRRSVSDSYIDMQVTRLRNLAQEDPELLDAMATGKFRDEPLAQIAESGRQKIGAGADRAPQALRDRLADLNDTGTSPAMVKGFLYGKARLGYNARVGDAFDKATQRAFKMLNTVSMRDLSVSADFRQEYYKAFDDLLPHMDPTEAASAVANAERAGVTGLDASKAVGSLDAQTADTIAKSRALDRMPEILHDFGHRKQYADMLRFVFPFGDAYTKVLSRWSKLVAENPAVLERARQGISAAEGSSFVHTDPSTGKLVMTVPLSLQIDKLVAGVPFPMSASLNGLSIVGNGLPGVGPAVSIPMSAIAPHIPVAQSLMRSLAPYGAPNIQQGVLEAFLPAWAQKIREGTSFASADQKSVFTHSVGEVLRWGASTGKYKFDTPGHIAAAVGDARHKAQALAFIRGGIQSTFPSPPSVDYMVKDKNGRMINAYLLTNELQNLYNGKGVDGKSKNDPAQASQIFLKLHGDQNFLSLQPFTTPRRYGLPTTAGASEWLAKHPGFQKDFPNVYGLLTPQKGAFDYSTYVRQIESGERVDRTSQDYVELGNARIGAMIYDQERDKLPDDASSADKSNYLGQLRTWLKAKYPGYDAQELQVEKASVPDAITELGKAITDKLVSGTQAAVATRQYLADRQQIIDWERQNGSQNHSNALSGAKEFAEQNQWLSDQASRLITQYPEFFPVWDQLLSHEVTLDQPNPAGV